MIFKPVLIEKILSGEKTVTRRPAFGTDPCQYREGREYGIQHGMARQSMARIRVVKQPHKEALGSITETDARNEGFESRAAFIVYWKDLYGSFDSYLEVWRIEFELVEHTRVICKCCDGDGTLAISDGSES